MTESEQSYLNNYFSHIYVEKEAMSYSLTQRLLNRFTASTIIQISHYKDMFNRIHQNFTLQKKAPALILAVKHGQLIYPGAKVCQSFGNDHFYYTSNIMNCIYDCEYCYLQGMYPSGNIVIFVNEEDYFTEVNNLLKEHPVYLCISYDTDLLALENLTGLVHKWTEFAYKHPDLKIEIRTKSAYTLGFKDFARGSNIIFAWTLSPDLITKKYEHKTPALDDRLAALRIAKDNGYTVRLCFDPMIYVDGYKDLYKDLFKKTFNIIHSDEILDVSIGLFRISSEYMKSMRRQRMSEITAYPYITQNGVCQYDEKKSDEILDFARNELSKYIDLSMVYDS